MQIIYIKDGNNRLLHACTSELNERQTHVKLMIQLFYRFKEHAAFAK